MKTKIVLLLLIGFVLGAATALMWAKHNSARSGPVGRYSMVNTPNGVCVMDTSTGIVKVISDTHLQDASHNFGTDDIHLKMELKQTMWLGNPFMPATKPR